MKLISKLRNLNKVIIQKHESSRLEDIKRKKIIVPKTRQISWLYYYIRKNIKLNETQSLFLFINNTSPNLSSTMDQVYQVIFLKLNIFIIKN